MARWESSKKLLFAVERLLYRAFPRPRNTYGIKADYLHRRVLLHFNDTATEDEYQDDVYRLAHQTATAHGLKTTPRSSIAIEGLASHEF